MKLKEVELYNPVKSLFEKYGYEVKAEIPFYSSSIDLIAHYENCIISVELKMSLTKKLIHQAYLNQLCSDFAYVAIPTKPRDLEHCKKVGLGIIQIINGQAEIILDAQNIFRPLKHHKQNILDWCEMRDPKMVGGKPMLKGEGPAIECSKRVLEYKEKHPHANWKEIFENVDNHYCSHNSMYNALRGFPVAHN